MDREAGVRRLNEADLHIADVERQITRQLLMIERLRADGQDALEAEHLLVAMHETLATYHEHRRLILGEIGRTGDGSM
ncbi:hypothetical protein [uncultured Methylobacterium sp.]|uniref:hypothetical protein n=1 Tax=uncultured Methylobacterium sp. TaxID=157278 RepID=UPI0026118020|nr:hypothetical protein [uncultured Methylobacterium sp.]